MGVFDGAVAIVTGGASGIGRATARRFAEAGARVLIADVQTQRGQDLASELGDAALFERVDVASEEQVSAAVDRAVKTWGRLDVMFNNAGLSGVVGPVHEIPVDEFDRAVGVILRGVFLGTKHAARVMRAEGRGSIVNTSSLAAHLVGLAGHAYAACKAGVEQFTKSVAMELGEAGIRVNAVSPGAIATPLMSEYLTGSYGQAGQIKDQMAQLQPIKRPGVPDDVANAVLWLSSPQASFINGQVLTIDGGMGNGILWSDSPAWLRAYSTGHRFDGPER